MKLDHIEDLNLAEGQHANALQSLTYIWSGLEVLYSQVHRYESALAESLDLANKTVLIMGNAPHLADVPQGLLACAFHWYATSGCNFVRLAGWLGLNQQPKRADAYVGRVIPAVRVWRNKVAAHFAITDPRSEDTAAVLESSVMFPVGFKDGRFVTQPFMLSVKRSGVASQSRADLSWSLTQVHEALRQRYRDFPTIS